MVHINKPSLFQRRSKSISSKHSDTEEKRHTRNKSSPSTLSSSTNVHHSKTTDGYNPLSLHPPLRLNTSPHVIEYDMMRYQEDEEREARFFNTNQTRHVQDHIQDMAVYSPIKGRNCYFQSPVSSESSQWPLKDCPEASPGLASDSGSFSSSATSETSSSPTTQSSSPRRRNAEWMNETDVFVKRGAWKRQGVVFELDERDAEFQENHFELPE
ncbi:hypothetical protein GGS20DRAFT_263178 [Poronia punctata]|nr:hypothetical protein GGS20DRAFT_263178 [Poronia punctata]